MAQAQLTRERVPASRASAIRAMPAAAGMAVLAGATLMLVALAAGPDSWLRGYVSEAGTAGQPFALAYRCGLIVLALGVGALGLGLRDLWRPLATLLGIAAVLAGTSGAVPCSARCPLPPFEPTTTADVVHASASIAGMIALAAAMAVAARSPLRRAMRVLAICAGAPTVLLGGWLGLIMAFAGRGPVGAAAERVLLFIAVAWLIGTAALITPAAVD